MSACESNAWLPGKQTMAITARLLSPAQFLLFDRKGSTRSLEDADLSGWLAGLRRSSIVARFVLYGPINGVAFTTWVEQCLV